MKIQSSSDNVKHSLDDKKITIYNCGPTVYNYVHIGNVRPLITFDVLYRYLLKIGKEVKFVHNITDVDDKIINQAAKDGITEKELADKYYQAYCDLFGMLNIKPLIMPRVSDHIQDIIDYVQKQVDAGAAYVVGGDVYFDVKAIPNYGCVSHQKIDELLDGVRKENDPKKKYPLDFALWKETNVGINWQSPWGKGRPGWHTECCVLINQMVGDHVTIHGGGVDLKFPHHENENAQNWALYKRGIADIWMHVGHINVDGAKMSKSLGNFILVKDIITEQNANGLRWFFYKTRYQHPINYTNAMLDESLGEINKIIASMSVAKTYLLANQQYWRDEKTALAKEFDEALGDDLNMPNAITELIAQVKLLNNAIRSKAWNNANALYNVIAEELNVLGIKWDKFAHEDNLETILSWKKAVDEKNYTKVDALRKELQDKNLL